MRWSSGPGGAESSTWPSSSEPWEGGLALWLRQLSVLQRGPWEPNPPTKSPFSQSFESHTLYSAPPCSANGTASGALEAHRDTGTIRAIVENTANYPATFFVSVSNCTMNVMYSQQQRSQVDSNSSALFVFDVSVNDDNTALRKCSVRQRDGGAQDQGCSAVSSLLVPVRLVRPAAIGKILYSLPLRVPPLLSSGLPAQCGRQASGPG